MFLEQSTCTLYCNTGLLTPTWLQKGHFHQCKPVEFCDFHSLTLLISSPIRVEGNQMEDRTTNKMWLVRHLEVTRQLVLEDFRVVKVKKKKSN